jgi:hypothetical protein
MIFSFTTQGREGVGAADYGLCAATTGNALVPSVVNTYRSGFGPVAAAMPPKARPSLRACSEDLRGVASALPAFSNSSTVTTTR